MKIKECKSVSYKLGNINVHLHLHKYIDSTDFINCYRTHARAVELLTITRNVCSTQYWKEAVVKCLTPRNALVGFLALAWSFISTCIRLSYSLYRRLAFCVTIMPDFDSSC